MAAFWKKAMFISPNTKNGDTTQNKIMLLLRVIAILVIGVSYMAKRRI